MKAIRKTAYFSTETLKARKALNKLFQSWKENDIKLRLFYSVKLSFIIEGETKTFYYKHKLKQFIGTKSVLQKILKGILHMACEDKHSHKSIEIKKKFKRLERIKH
jgi:hypothetical protein